MLTVGRTLRPERYLMDIHEKIIELLVASGNISEEKVEQARKLAESLVWDGEAAQQSVQSDGERAGVPERPEPNVTQSQYRRR